MPLIKITPELIEKNHWRYQQMIHKNTNQRINKIINYSRFDIEDLALLLNVDIKTVKRYARDYTKMPLNKSWLLSQILNVRLDCFSDIARWQNQIIDTLPHTEETPEH